MSVPREVWIAEEATIIAVSYESVGADIVATGNVTLSGASQTIDGQAATAGKYVLCVAQSTFSQNGLYEVQSGSWVPYVPQQPLAVFVGTGTHYANTYWNLIGVNSYSQALAPPVIRSETYSQNLAIQFKYQNSKRGQPGAAAQDNLAIPDGITIQITAYYERKDQQVQPFLAQGTLYRMELSLVNPQYSGSGDNANDDHVFRNCTVTDQKITVVDDKVIEAVLTLEAEYMQ